MTRGPGGGRAALDEVGAAETGPLQGDPEQADTAQAGIAQTGPARNGPALTGAAGTAQTGEAGTDQTQGKPDQADAGQIGAAGIGAAQGRPDRAVSDRPGGDRTGPNQAGAGAARHAPNARADAGPGGAAGGVDVAGLAALHARCFARPRPWSAAEFAEILAARGAFLAGDAEGFVLGRVVAGEAEMLTLAVPPEARRRGRGRALAAAFAGRAADLGAAEAFLEVARENVAARALYAGAGWVEAGVRPRYYGPASDAIVMRLTLRAIEQGG